MWYLAKSSFRSAVVVALSAAILVASIGLSPISGTADVAHAAEAPAAAAASYPRLMAWWPDVHSIPAAEIARYDAVILYDWAAPQAKTIKAADPSTDIFLSTSASELTMYTEVNPEAWKNAKLAAASARWSVTQPGSTLTSAITATATTIGVAVADSTRFRVGDVLVIDEEFLEVQAVNAGTPGSLVVRRNAVVAGTRHAAAAHAAGARVAAVVREFPNTVLMDLTDNCPLVDVGNGPENFNMYLARVSAASISDPVWDGIYFDMIESNKSWVLDAGFARAFDLTRSNVVPANADAFNAAWAIGVRKLEERVRALVGDRPVLTNGADANWDLINGTCVERFPTKTTTTAEWRSRVFGTQVPYAGANYFAGLSGLKPNYSNLITYDQEDPNAALSAATSVDAFRERPQIKNKLSALALFSTLALSGSVLADGWTIGPAFKDGWNPEFTLAAVGGSMDADHVDSGLYTGLEFSLNCPWFQPPKGTIRQQFNIGRFDEDGLEVTSFEMNPNYFMTLAPNWTLGVGPGIGYAKASYKNGDTEGLWSIQASANLNYRNGHLFAGVGARYQDTRDKHLAPGVDGADNWLVSAAYGMGPITLAAVTASTVSTSPRRDSSTPMKPASAWRRSSRDCTAAMESSWLWAVCTCVLSTSLRETEPTSNSTRTRRSLSRASWSA